jgi:hypothetical protein
MHNRRRLERDNLGSPECRLEGTFITLLGSAAAAGAARGARSSRECLIGFIKVARPMRTRARWLHFGKA